MLQICFRRKESSCSGYTLSIDKSYKVHDRLFLLNDQILYVTLVMAGIAIHWLAVEPHLPKESYWMIAHNIAPIVILWTFWTFWTASRSNPGFIYEKNHAKVMSLYDHDHILFTSKECSTCRFVKPARSKHCSMCGGCIARMDHHCIWINNCVGYANHRHFLHFLLSTSILCWMGAALSFVVVRNYILVNDVFQWKYLDVKTQKELPLSYSQVLTVRHHFDLFLDITETDSAVSYRS